MDRRQRKSREAIFRAFNSLLTQKKYTEITVQDIIDRADVGRTTFYAHFETKDALLEELCTELFGHVVHDHDEAEETHDFSEEENNTESIITHILYHLRDDQKNMLGIFNGESGDLFFRFFKQYLIGVFEVELKDELKKVDVPKGYLYHQLSCGFVDTLRWWIQSGLKQTPEQVEQYFRRVMAAVIT